MSEIINVYCDENCHLENDQERVMVLGAVWCPKDRSSEISKRIREIKAKHNLAKFFEIKWTKVSPAKQSFYLDVLDYFFDDDDLHFRALIIPDKTILDHRSHSQTHDDWYYKMFFDTLKVIINPELRYHIYLDYKDTRGAAKIAKLHDVLTSANYDFARQIVEKIQTVRSHEVEIIQITDLLIGVVSYINRGLSSNSGKVRLVERMKERSGYSLTKTTLYRENKVNLLNWKPSEI